MPKINPIFITLTILGAVCAALVGVGLIYAAAVPIAITAPIILYILFRGSEGRGIKSLQFCAIGFVICSLLWPRYAAFYLPGLPLINPQRIANTLVIVIIFTTLITNTYLRNEIKISYKNNKAFWLALFVYLAARAISVGMSEDIGTSAYRFTQEIFVHVIFLLLGLHIGSRVEFIQSFFKIIALGLAATSILAVIEFTLKKNIFSYFITAQNEYMAWALSDKIRDGVYRAKSTFDHPLTFSEFVGIATPLSIYCVTSLKSKFWSFLLTIAIVTCAVTSILLSGSRSGYVAIAITAFIVATAPAIFTIIHKKLTLKKAAGWSFAIILLAAIFTIGAQYLYEYTLGSKSYSASDEARVEMVNRSIYLAENSPLYGYGIGLAAQKIGVKINPLGDYTVDSIYLTFLVESGVIALFSFLFFCLYAIRNSWKAASDINKHDWHLWSALGASLLSILAFKSVLSLLDNNYLMYILIGIATSRLNSEKNDRIP